MPGVLDGIFNVRTNGNGYIEQEWDDVLLRREIASLVADGRVQEIPCPDMENAKQRPQAETRCYRDLETGDTYKYSGHWERGMPRFCKITSN